MSRLLSIAFILSLLLFYGCRSNISGEHQKSGNTLIVLGFPATDQGKPTPLMKYRLDLALDLYQKNQISYILVTGGAVQNRHPEAAVMKEYLIENGVKSGKIITETRSSSTIENAAYSRKILKKMEIKNPTVVTSPEHRKRAAWIFSLFFREFTMAE